MAEAEEEQAAEAARIAQEAKEKGETEEMDPSVERVSSSFMAGGEEEEHLSHLSSSLAMAGGTEVMLQSTQRNSINVPPLFTVFTFVYSVYLRLLCLPLFTVLTFVYSKHRKQK